MYVPACASAPVRQCRSCWTPARTVAAPGADHAGHRRGPWQRPLPITLDTDADRGNARCAEPSCPRAHHRDDGGRRRPGDGGGDPRGDAALWRSAGPSLLVSQLFAGLLPMRSLTAGEDRCSRGDPSHGDPSHGEQAHEEQAPPEDVRRRRRRRPKAPCGALFGGCPRHSEAFGGIPRRRGVEASETLVTRARRPGSHPAGHSEAFRDVRRHPRRPEAFQGEASETSGGVPR